MTEVPQPHVAAVRNTAVCGPGCSRLSQRLGMFVGEEPVLRPVYHQERKWCDPAGRLLGVLGPRLRPRGRDHAGLHDPADDLAAHRVLHPEVKPTHDRGPPVVPEGGAAHSDGTVHATDQTGVAHHDRGSHREPQCHHARESQRPGPRDSSRDIQDLLVPQGAQTLTRSVSAQLHCHHGECLGQHPLHDQIRFFGDCGVEPMHHHDGQVAGRAIGLRRLVLGAVLRHRRGVSGVQSDPVPGQATNARPGNPHGLKRSRWDILAGRHLRGSDATAPPDIPVRPGGQCAPGRRTADAHPAGPSRRRTPPCSTRRHTTRSWSTGACHCPRPVR